MGFEGKFPGTSCRKTSRNLLELVGEELLKKVLRSILPPLPARSLPAGIRKIFTFLHEDNLKKAKNQCMLTF